MQMQLQFNKDRVVLVAFGLLDRFPLEFFDGCQSIMLEVRRSNKRSVRQPYTDSAFFVVELPTEAYRGLELIGEKCTVILSSSGEFAGKQLGDLKKDKTLWDLFGEIKPQFVDGELDVPSVGCFRKLSIKESIGKLEDASITKVDHFLILAQHPRIYLFIPKLAPFFFKEIRSFVQHFGGVPKTELDKFSWLDSWEEKLLQKILAEGVYKLQEKEEDKYWKLRAKVTLDRYGMKVSVPQTKQKSFKRFCKFLGLI